MKSPRAILPATLNTVMGDEILYRRMAGRFVCAIAFPAVNGYFFLPTYATLLAAISFDQTGTTRIGKYILNHSFMIPGMVATVSSVVIAFLIGKIVL